MEEQSAARRVREGLCLPKCMSQVDELCDLSAVEAAHEKLRHVASCPIKYCAKRLLKPACACKRESA